jgi:hypothetical protein
VEECNKQSAVAAKWSLYMECADRIEAKGTFCASSSTWIHSVEALVALGRP